MYKITNEERATLFAQMTDLLNKFEYEYSTIAIDKIIDKWCENKGTLIEAFKKHPNYIDGKFLIAFESDYEREIDSGAIDNFRYYLQRMMYFEDVKNNLPDKVKERLDSGFYDTCCLPNDIWNLMYFDFTCYKHRTIDEYWCNRINAVMPEIKAHNGEKTSRVMNRICTYLNYHKHPDYNREFAKYADALTPRIIKRHTILSINPLDYLTMSFGNSWSSCHTIDKHNIRGVGNGYEGCYSSGTISYMLDTVSMVFYTVNADYNEQDFFTQDKITRQMFHYGEDKLVQGRLYPQSNDSDENGFYKQYRGVVQDIIANIFNFPNLWVKSSSNIEKYVWSEGTHYRDYECFNACNLSKIKASENEHTITIGHEPICIDCGSYHDCECNINCCTDDTYVYCTQCGGRVHRDDVYWIDDEPYCCDCVYYCDHCGEYYPAEQITWVENAGRYGRYVCQDCLDENYTRCNECGEYFEVENMMYIDSEDIWVCNDCFEDEFTNCEECDEIIRREDVMDIVDNFGNTHKVCASCFNELREQYNEIAIENERLLNEAHEDD